jgi:hypothetical protein
MSWKGNGEDPLYLLKIVIAHSHSDTLGPLGPLDYNL